jgi:restriction system protein
MVFQVLGIILHALPWWVLALLPVSLLLSALRTPAVKGWTGEMVIHLLLRTMLDRRRYLMFHNLILPTPDGTTQVDHVIVSRHGIFVIETKHFSGWIFGSERNRTWTQKFPKRSVTFQNPLRQNYKHVRALAELTGVPDRALFSLVVFVGDCTFKTPMPDNVTRAPGCLAYIRARSEVLLSEAEVEGVVARIARGRVAPSLAANAAHARHVRERFAQRAEAPVRTPAAPAASAAPAAERIEPTVPAVPAVAPAVLPPAAPAAVAPCCPRCGSVLGDYTYRSGERAGQTFRGCTGFPGCRYRTHLAAPTC